MSSLSQSMQEVSSRSRAESSVGSGLQKRDFVGLRSSRKCSFFYHEKDKKHEKKDFTFHPVARFVMIRSSSLERL